MEHKKANAYAVVGLALGILTFFQALGLEKAAAAIVFGILGIRAVKKDQEASRGKGLAIAGVTLGAVYIVMIVMMYFTQPGLFFPKK